MLPTYTTTKTELSLPNFKIKLIQQQFGRIQNKVV